jgi:hypothetical protein
MITSQKLRELALSLPEVEERETWGEPTFRVRGKIFLILSTDNKGASIKASLANQDALIRLHPEVFSVSHYTGRFGWVNAKLSKIDPDLLRELVIAAWRRTASKRLVAAYDAQQDTS